MKETVTERFLRYIKVDTRSQEDAATYPSTEKQKNLGRMLYKELQEMGIEQVWFDEEKGYVYATLPGTPGRENDKTIGFIAHMDTAPDISGECVNPQFVDGYDGNTLVLNEELGIFLSPEKFPELKDYIGKHLITTDGTTLLGADDKAGVAEIMTMAEALVSHPEWEHGPVAIAFTPDEEVGSGVDYFALERFGADYAYTVDGGALGEIEYENFNAASAKIRVRGVNVHPGEAKNKMKNASLIAMELEYLLPRQEKPEYTSGYEGFYHLTDMTGNEEGAKLSYIIRDHSRKEFEKKKKYLQHCVKLLNEKYGEGTLLLEMEDSYYNMKEKIQPEYNFLIDQAKTVMEEMGITPKIQPIRGGTDGARLSYLGLPCPNLCAGGHNFHGRYEYCCVESMEKIAELLQKLAMLEYK